MKLVMNKESLKAFGGELKANLDKNYKTDSKLVYSDFGSNYNNKYMKATVEFMLPDEVQATFTNYVLDNRKTLYGMSVSSFGPQKNDHEDIIATLDF